MAMCTWVGHEHWKWSVLFLFSFWLAFVFVMKYFFLSFSNLLLIRGYINLIIIYILCMWIIHILEICVCVVGLKHTWSRWNRMSFIEKTFLRATRSEKEKIFSDSSLITVFRVISYWLYTIINIHICHSPCFMVQW